MTGRKGRFIKKENGQMEFQSRSESEGSLDKVNILEKTRFMSGKKLVAVISAAASTGISLHADRRVNNTRRRLHITLELPWGPDQAIQQFGRTNRSNQVFAPDYIILISDLAGEQRFISSVSKRMENLGALTQGDRRATDKRDLSHYNVETEFGQMALEATLKTIIGLQIPVVPPPDDYEGEFFKDVKVGLKNVGIKEKFDEVSVQIFLNRILGMPVRLQKRLFDYFSTTLEAIVSQAKKSGRFDMGIVDLRPGKSEAKKTQNLTFTIRHPTGTAKTVLQTFLVDCGMSWEVALQKSAVLVGAHEGFYVSIRKPVVVQLIADCGAAARRGLEKGESLYTISRPNTGLQQRQESLTEIKKVYKQIGLKEAKFLWNNHYYASKTKCSHAFWNGKCHESTAGGFVCQMGLRQRNYSILSGPVLSVWDKVESVLAANGGGQIQVVRLHVGGIRIIGINVPGSCMPQTIKLLTKEAENVCEEVF